MRSLMRKNLMNIYKRSVPIQLPSLYHIEEDDNNNNRSLSHSKSVNPDPDSPIATPDFATVLASRRFFFSSPGRSNSIIDSSSSSSCSSSLPPSTSKTSPIAMAKAKAKAIPTYSPDPYIDFRRSMEEMVYARCLFDVRSNWERLHELLVCYLALNAKSTHKFIIGAFEDLLVSLRADGISGETDCEM